MTDLKYPNHPECKVCEYIDKDVGSACAHPFCFHVSSPEFNPFDTLRAMREEGEELNARLDATIAILQDAHTRTATETIEAALKAARGGIFKDADKKGED